MSRNVTGVRIELLGDLVTLREYCGVMRECESKVRRQLRVGTCRVPPAMTRPYRWRRVDLDAHIRGASAVTDRKRHARAHAGAAVAAIGGARA